MREGKHQRAAGVQALYRPAVVGEAVPFRLLELRRQSGTGCPNSNQPPGSMVTTSTVAARQARTSMVRIRI